MNLATALRAALACLLVCSGAVAPAAALATSATPDSSSEAPAAIDTGRTVLQQAGDGETNNSSVRHENPDEVDGDGDVARIRSHLVGQLAGRLNGSVVNLTQEQYRQARGILGDSYSDDLEKLVDVAGETEETNGFESAADRQREYVREVQRFRQTREEYEEAVAAGNETRARERARELNRIASELNRTESDLLESYDSIENATEADLSAETETIETTTANVSETAAAITDRELQGTRLSLSVPDRTVSFLDPLQLSGRLETANGTALANRTVRLQVGERMLRVQTNGTGAFTVAYRPTLLSADAETLPVSYRPDGASVYLPSNASVPVDVQRVTARASVEATGAAGFADAVTVHGRVTAAGVPVDGVPVRVSVGGVSLGVVRTSEAGTYALRTTLPANVAPGEATVTTTLAAEGRAVNVTPAREAMQIEETDTRLGLNATVTNREEGTVRVTGRLRAAGGPAVPGGSVDLRAGGTVLASVSTGADGQFSVTVELPASLADRDAVSLVAAFDAAGTNLRASRARARIVLQQDGGSGAGGGSGGDGSGLGVGGGDGDGAGGGEGVPGVNLPVPEGSLPVPVEWLVVLAAGVLAAVGGAGVYALTVGGDESTADDTAPAAGGMTEESDDARAEAAADEDDGGDPLAEAATRLDSEPTVAAQLAYTLVRDALAERQGVLASDTPREAVRSYRASSGDDTGEGGKVEALERLTGVYERAAFGPTGVPRADVEEALDDARTVLGAAE